MKFYFCETCGKRLTEKDIAEGAGRDKKLKGVFCQTCAVGVTTMDEMPMDDREARRVLQETTQKDSKKRAATPAGATKFYFCEKCGERLSEKEIEAGKAKDKQLAGVYCTNCAEGVLTIETVPMSDEAARALLKKDRPSGRYPESGRQEGPLRARKSSGLRMQAVRPSGRKRGDAVTRPSGGGAGALIGVVVGVVVLLIAAVLFLSSGDGDKRTAKKPRKKRQIETAVKSEEVSPGAVPSESKAIQNVANPAPPKALTPEPQVPEVRPPQPQSPSVRFDIVESYVRQKNFSNAQTQLDAIAGQVPEGEAGSEELKKKIKELKSKIVEGSEAKLDEILKNAQANADAGDLTGLRSRFAPIWLNDLLPSDAAAARAKEVELRKAVEARLKEIEAEKQRKLAELRAAFEKSLPAPGDLAPLEAKTIFFAEKDITNGAKILNGEDSLRKPDGKCPYFDGSKHIGFTHNNDVGMIPAGKYGIQYSAAEDIQIHFWGKCKQFGKIGTHVTLPAGKLQTMDFPFTQEFMKWRGGKLGRTIYSIHFGFKNVKPGTLAVFRVWRYQ